MKALIALQKRGCFKTMRQLLSFFPTKSSSFDYHSHPHNDDIIPSERDIKAIKKISLKTRQSSSMIITPNGKKSSYNGSGIMSVGTIEHTVNDDYKKALAQLLESSLYD